MNLSARWMLLVSIALVACFDATAAQGQASRTWVSGSGDDANPCTRTAPCMTFAAALSVTVAGGEINVLDPGGFGAVTITKSISIYNDGVGEAGVLVSGTNGIVIAAGANDVVNLRGLVINGLGTGLNGVSFISGAQVNIANSVIQQFVSTDGVNLSPNQATNSSVHIQDTLIVGNTAGILAQPIGGGSLKLTLDRLRVVGGAGGIRLVGPVNVAISDSSVNNNSSNGVNVVTASGQTTTVSIINSTIANNGLAGIQLNQAPGGTGNVSVGGSLLLQNGSATSIVVGGSLRSYGNNQVVGPLGSGFSATGGLQ